MRTVRIYGLRGYGGLCEYVNCMNIETVSRPM